MISGFAFLLLLSQAKPILSVATSRRPSTSSILQSVAKRRYDFLSRGLQDAANETNAERCSICPNGNLLGTSVPPYVPNEMTPAGLTCADFDSFGDFLEVGSPDCVGLQQLSVVCCELPFSAYECEQNTRAEILDGMDPVVSPALNYTNPLQVSVTITYQAINNLNVQQSTTEMFVWVDLTWKDLRLAWDRNSNPETCAQVVSARASMDPERTEIWVPDFDLYNRLSSLHSFEETNADIFPDGTVLWRRAGSLTVVCQFKGLAQIPYDDLGCQLIFGSTGRLGLPGFINYVLDESTGGLQFGNFTPTYTEYALRPQQSTAEKNSTAIYYTFVFERAKQYYVFHIVIPTIILTFVSFGTFLLDLRLGERLSYGMSLALVIVAQSITTSDLLPVTGDRLWIDKFVGWSFYWVIFGLVESVFVSYLSFMRTDREPNSGKEEEEVVVFDSGEPKGTGVAPETSEHPRAINGKSFLYSSSLRGIDKFCFFLCSSTYLVFLIAMFVSVPAWGKRVDPKY